MHRESASSGKSRLSIKVVVFGALGALALLTIGACSKEALRSLRAYYLALDQQSSSAAADRLIRGTYAILLERVVTDGALQAVAPADEDVRKKIGAYRKSAADLYDPALAEIAQHNFANKASLIDDLKAKLRKVEDTRRQADSAIAVARDQRDENLRKNFVPVVTDMVNASLNLWYSVVYSAAKGDSILVQLAAIKEIGWKMREFSGFARAAVSGAIASGNPISSDRMAVIADNRVRVNALWLVLENLTRDPQTHPAIIEAMRQAQEKYFKNFLLQLDDVRKAGESSRYPMTAAGWVEATNPQIDSLLAIMQAAETASDERTRSVIESSFLDLLFQIGMFVFCIVVVLGGIAIVIRQVTRPLTALSGAMRELAHGNLEIMLPGLDCRNEVGDVAEVAELLKTKAIEKIHIEQQIKEEESRQIAARKADMRRLADQFQQTVGEIVDTVSATAVQLERAAVTLANAAETAQKRVAAVVAASEDASTKVNTVASATEEISSSIDDIGRQVHESDRIANEAVDQAQKTDSRIAMLSQAANRIGDVTKLINKIAEQTNLLALNATIEAARAGVAGKGFAVVAEEVKQLATQTAKATSEISSQIAEMQTATQDSVHAIKEIGETIARISEIATIIAAAVAEQGASTQAITRNLQQAAVGATQVVTNITDVNRGAAETGSASAQVLSSARSLANDSNRLKTEMDKFLAMIRAA